VYQDILLRTPQFAFFPERYEVQKILGKDELGVVYLLFDREENLLQAATILDPAHEFTDEELDKFAGRMGKLSTPRISRILGFHKHRANIYMLTEFIDGLNLRQRLGQEEPMTYKEAMQIARQVTEALEDGHQQGLPFLILRPTNIMLSSNGVKLVNYGISQLTSSRRKPAGKSKKYMDDYLAPEQLSGGAGDERSDIYALGTILYEMLIGNPPSVGRFYYPSEVNIEATEAVDILIDHSRETDPKRRFATATEMRMEIDRITTSSPWGSPNQVLRVGLAWISERYKKLILRRGLYFLLPVLAILLVLSLAPNIPTPAKLLARVGFPLLLNSLVTSVLCDWGIRTLAKMRGLGSLSTSGRGMGAILGFLITFHMFRLNELDGIIQTPYPLDIFFATLTFSIFLTALFLIFVIAVAWVIERLFKSYTSGFYWSFVAILILELILIILRQPTGMVEFPQETPESAGQVLVETSGCIGCHSTDGSDGIGPTWFQLAGSGVVLTGGSTVIANDAYLIQSIREPQAAIVDGFETQQMPAYPFTDQQVANIIAYIKTLR
jgi:serine/threonine protein kinase/cytochrome c551/c552